MRSWTEVACTSLHLGRAIGAVGGAGLVRCAACAVHLNAARLRLLRLHCCFVLRCALRQNLREGHRISDLLMAPSVTYPAPAHAALARCSVPRVKGQGLCISAHWAHAVHLRVPLPAANITLYCSDR